LSRTPFRGSRKHLLDLLDAAEGATGLNAVLADHGVSVSPAHPCRPRGHHDPEEWTLRAFCRTHCQQLMDYRSFAGWWVPERYTNPTWDLLSICSVNGRTGILLVEAKAHEAELDWGPKPLPKSASEQSRRNHERIRTCIEEARAWLDAMVGGGVTISADSHYQLSNRVSSAWKLAACGLPTVLLYLGFTGDTSFDHHFVDADHWQRCMGAYLHGVLPQSLPGCVLHHPSDGSFLLLVNSLPIVTVSH
jgi:hypothetical protein